MGAILRGCNPTVTIYTIKLMLVTRPAASFAGPRVCTVYLLDKKMIVCKDPSQV